MSIWQTRTPGARRGKFKPRFMSHTYFADEMTQREREELERSRLRRGVCPKCGTRMAVGPQDDNGIQLLCSCGRREYAKKGYPAYKNALLIAANRDSNG